MHDQSDSARSPVPAALKELSRLDPSMAELLHCRWLEAMQCEQSQLHFAASLLYVTVMEGYLSCLLGHSTTNDVGGSDLATEHQKLEQLINIAKERSWLNPALINIAQGLRFYRNCVHPTAQLQLGRAFDASVSHSVFIEVTQVLDELRASIDRVRIQRDFPVQLPRELYGREEDRQRFNRLVPSSRIITIFGPPGVGKTVFAEYCAQQHNKLQLCRVLSVHLEYVCDEADLVSRIMEVFSPYEAKHSIPLLLILHGGEHFGDGLACCVQDIQNHFPRLKVIVTTQHPTGIPSEAVLYLGGIATASADQKSPSPALMLLQDEVRQRSPGWSIIDSKRQDYINLCADLDGIPLAIKIAATELAGADVREVRRRIQVGAGGDSIYSAFLDSFERLPEGDQIFLKATATFRGSVAVRLVLELLKGQGITSSVDSAIRLADYSWVQCSEGQIALLNIVRQFIRRVTKPDHAAKLRKLQADVLTSEIYPSGFADLNSRSSETACVDNLESIVEAVEWHIENKIFTDSACAILVALAWRWSFTGRSEAAHEICQRATRAWPLVVSIPLVALYRVTATLTRQQGDYEGAFEYLNRVVSMCKDGNLEWACLLVQDIGDVFWGRGDLERAETTFIRSLQMIDALSKATSEATRLRSRALEQLGNVSRAKGDAEASRNYVRQAREALERTRMRGSGYEWIRAWMYLQEANATFDLGLTERVDHARCWRLLYLSGKDFQSHLEDTGLACVAERALRVLLLEGDANLVRRMYIFSKQLRLTTGSMPQQVDRDEYLDRTLEVAENRFLATFDGEREVDNSLIRQQLVGLLQNQFDAYDVEVSRDLIGSTRSTVSDG